jgi:hypothetical protein
MVHNVCRVICNKAVKLSIAQVGLYDKPAVQRPAYYFDAVIVRAVYIVQQQSQRIARPEKLAAVFNGFIY